MWRRLLRNAMLGTATIPAVCGALVFTHIEYDPIGNDDGREWVEIENTGIEPVDLAGFRFLENGVKHKLTPIGATVLAPGARAIIADSADTYRAEHAGYPGLIFDSSFSLKNTGETLAILNASGTEMVSTAYTPTPKATPAPKESAPEPKAARNQEPQAPSIEEPVPRETLAAVAEAPEGPRESIAPWLMALAAVIGAGVFSLFAVKPKESSGYTIVEDKNT